MGRKRIPNRVERSCGPEGQRGRTNRGRRRGGREKREEKRGRRGEGEEEKRKQGQDELRSVDRVQFNFNMSIDSGPDCLGVLIFPKNKPTLHSSFSLSLSAYELFIHYYCNTLLSLFSPFPHSSHLWSHSPWGKRKKVYFPHARCIPLFQPSILVLVLSVQLRRTSPSGEIGINIVIGNCCLHLWGISTFTTTQKYMNESREEGKKIQKYKNTKTQSSDQIITTLQITYGMGAYTSTTLIAICVRPRIPPTIPSSFPFNFLSFPHTHHHHPKIGGSAPSPIGTAAKSQ